MTDRRLLAISGRRLFSGCPEKLTPTLLAQIAEDAEPRVTKGHLHILPQGTIIILDASAVGITQLSQ